MSENTSKKNNIAPVFKGNFVIRGKIECLTGLHIGGSKEKLEIGGVDSPVIRNPQTKYPYIPGSSIKGKMRSLLEFNTGAVLDYIDNLGSVSKSENIVRIFGIGADQQEKAGIDTGPTRIVVRDCNPDEATINMWEKMDSELLYTEYKPENTIDRLTAAANPRFIERVVAGSKFNFEIVYSVIKLQKDETNEPTQKDLNNLMAGLRLLENSALGKSGSRGYGQIKLHIVDPIFISTDDYQTGKGNYGLSKKAIKNDDLKSLEAIKLEYND